MNVNCKWIWKDVEAVYIKLYSSIFWRDSGKPQNTSDKTAGSQTEIRIRDFLSIKWEE